MSTYVHITLPKEMTPRSPFHALNDIRVRFELKFSHFTYLHAKLCGQTEKIPSKTRKTISSVLLWSRRSAIWRILCEASKEFGLMVVFLEPNSFYARVTPFLIRPNLVFSCVAGGKLVFRLRLFTVFESGVLLVYTRKTLAAKY